jgi:hypothetical protein
MYPWAGRTHASSTRSLLSGHRQGLFNDDKEGLLGMRVAHWLESADEKGGIFMDASGRPTRVDQADTTGATGVYLTSEGVRGGAVWGTRGRWCALTGHDADKHEVTIGMMDSPKNPGIPRTGMRGVMDCSLRTRWGAASSIPNSLRSTSPFRRIRRRHFAIGSFCFRVLLARRR